MYTRGVYERHEKGIRHTPFQKNSIFITFCSQFRPSNVLTVYNQPIQVKPQIISGLNEGLQFFISIFFFVKSLIVVFSLNAPNIGRGGPLSSSSSAAHPTLVASITTEVPQADFGKTHYCPQRFNNSHSCWSYCNESKCDLLIPHQICKG